MELRKYKLVVEEFHMQGHPQTRELIYIVEAHTAADAIAIGQVRHNFPATYDTYSPRLYTRRLKDVVPIA